MRDAEGSSDDFDPRMLEKHVRKVFTKLGLPEVQLGVALAWVCVLGAGRYALWTGRGASPMA